MKRLRFIFVAVLLLAFLLCFGSCVGTEEPAPTETTACEHEYEETVSLEPTCENVGFKKTTCVKCGESTTNTMAALGHDEVIDAAVAPTCTTAGLTEGKHCSRCNTVFAAQQTVVALGHVEVIDVAKSATCTDAGLTEGKHCSRCNTVFVAQQTVAALGHSEVIDAAVAPTCTATGLTEGKHCSTCSTVFIPQQTVGATGHTEVIDEGVLPTCTAAGLSEGKHCSMCSTILIAREPVAAFGHNEVTDAAVTPTCTTTGLTEGKHCSVCGTVFTAQYIIPARHTEVIDVAVAATCTENGLTSGKHCSVCGTVTVAQQTIVATGHSYDNDEDATCNTCGFERDVACKHNNTSTLASVNPTCTATGLSAGTKCDDCGEILTEQQVLSALGHTEEIDAAVSSTCTTTGLTEGKHCSVCGEILVAQENVNALGHDEVIDAAVAPTCTATGLTAGKHCSRCSTTLVAQQTVGTIAHTEVVDPAVASTCTSSGLTEGKHCSVCGTVTVAQEVVTAINHTEYIASTVAPTCQEDGYHTIKCSVCENTVRTDAIAKGHYSEGYCDLCYYYCLLGTYTFYRMEGDLSLPLVYVDFSYSDSGKTISATNIEYDGANKRLYFDGVKVYDNGTWLIDEQYITFSSAQKVDSLYYTFISENTSAGKYALSGEWFIDESEFNPKKEMQLLQNIDFRYTTKNDRWESGESISIYKNVEAGTQGMMFDKNYIVFEGYYHTIYNLIDFGGIPQEVDKEFYLAFTQFSVDCADDYILVGDWWLNDSINEPMNDCYYEFPDSSGNGHNKISVIVAAGQFKVIFETLQQNSTSMAWEVKNTVVYYDRGKTESYNCPISFGYYAKTNEGFYLWVKENCRRSDTLMPRGEVDIENNTLTGAFQISSTFSGGWGMSHGSQSIGFLFYGWVDGKYMNGVRATMSDHVTGFEIFVDGVCVYEISEGTVSINKLRNNIVGFGTEAQVLPSYVVYVFSKQNTASLDIA